MFVPSVLKAVAAAVAIALGSALVQASAPPLVVERPWAAAPPHGASVGAAYMTIRNPGRTQVRILAAASPVAERVELHAMSLEGGVMRMRELIGGVTVPAGGVFKFTPSGAHFMLIGLKGPLLPGAAFDLRLQLEGGRHMVVRVAVEARGGHAH